MDGIDRITPVPGVKIELYSLVDAPKAHDPHEQGKRQSGSAHGHDQDAYDDADSKEDDNGAYDGHGHLIHDPGEDPPPDIPHINTMV